MGLVGGGLAFGVALVALRAGAQEKIAVLSNHDPTGWTPDTGCTRSTDAEVLSMLDVGACVSVDAVCRGWVRTAARTATLPCARALPDSKPRAGGWVLVDGASLGLGALLEPVSPYA